MAVQQRRQMVMSTALVPDRRSEAQDLRDAIHKMACRYADSSMKTMERLPTKEAIKHFRAVGRRYTALMRLTARLADLCDSTTPREVLNFRTGRLRLLPGGRQE